MEREAVPPLGAVLRRYRAAAGLTQEELAARAGISVRGLSDLERGVKTRPHRDTIHLLAQALSLGPAERETLQRAARRPESTVAAMQRRTNLPVQLTSFVGRQQEKATVLRLLDHTRLLTLTGTGGIGKTRLALHVTADLRDRYRDGVWLVELAPLTDPALVPLALATVLDVCGDDSRPPQDTLVEALRGRHLLLVLDNCEHLLDACAPLVEALLRGVPHLQVLATSREALGCASETAWRVPALVLPAVDPHPTLDTLADSEAVQLFTVRAGLAQPGFMVRGDNAAVVAQICRRLDGIPLALELAAARLSGLSVTDLAARLEHRFRLLTAGRRTALPRQQTLQATVDWSYALLSPPEQVLFARLSVFAGGFPLDAAEAVGAGGDLTPPEVVELLLWLVAKSLVQVDEGVAGETRYRLLETLRQYGRERLAERGDGTAVRARHAAYMLALAERAEPYLREHDQMTWLTRLDAALDDVRVALRWYLEKEAVDEGARLLWALTWFWYRRSPSEAEAWATQFLALPDLQAPSRLRARMLILAGSVTHDATAGQPLLQEAVGLCRDLDDELALALAREAQANHATDVDGDNARARPLFDECLALYRRLDRRWAMAAILCKLAQVACADGDLDQARSHEEELRALAAATDDLRLRAFAVEVQGKVAPAAGDTGAAMRLWSEAQALYQVVGDGIGVAYTAAHQGEVERQQGRHAAARRHYAAAVQGVQEQGLAAQGLEWLAVLAVIAVDTGHAAQGLRLAAASTALGAAHPASIPAAVREDLDRATATARVRLGARAAALWAEGQMLTLGQAVAVAVNEPASPGGVDAK